MTLVFLLGLVNWFVTVLLVESEFFRPLRDWVVRRQVKAKRALAFWFWGKVDYLVTCYMCSGTWIGLALAPFAPALFGPGVVQFVLVGLLIKAIGHLVLVVHKLGEEKTNEYKR